MTFVPLLELAKIYLHKFCFEIPTRRVGTKGNQTAKDLFASIISSFGFETKLSLFNCFKRAEQAVERQI